MSEPQPPDDRTVRIAAPAAGASASDGSGDRLPFGTRLAEFEITGFVGEGGFSVVYLAWDHSLERRVALKEYMPSSLAARNSTTHTVAARSERHRETFDAGLKSFVNEGKLLAQFDHPSLVKVYRFWEQQGTAYMVMPFYEGVTLKDHVRALATPPDEAWLRQLLDALTAALLVLHRVQCFHRDIAPDNILLLAGSGKPLLLDFGAARRVIGDKTQALTVILKPGYAPIEQYAEDPGMRQGPWTDVYALAAVVYWAITGKTPPPSVGRVLNDTYVPLVQCAAGRYGEGFLAAIDRALRVRPEQRTASIERLREALGLDLRSARADPEATVMRPPPPPPRQAPPPPQRPHGDAPAQSARGLRWATAGSAALVAAAGAAWWLQRASPPPAPSPPAPQAQRPTPSPPAAAQPTPEPPATATAVPAPTPANTQAVLSQIDAGRDAGIELQAALVTERNGATRLQYQASESGYAYVLGPRPGSNELVMLYPARGKLGLKLGSNGKLDVPLPATAGVPAYYLLWARESRNLAEGGWFMREPGWVRSLDAGSAPVAAAAAWGAPQCVARAKRCDPAYAMTEVIDMTNVMSAPPVSANAEKPRTAATDKAAQDGRGEAAPTRLEGVATEGKPRPPRNAECVEALRRASLGDASPELIEKLKSADCR